MVKLSFPAHFRNTVSNMNRTKLTKTIKTHIYVYIFILFMYGSVLKSRPKNISHMLQECSKK